MSAVDEKTLHVDHHDDLHTVDTAVHIAHETEQKSVSPWTWSMLRLYLVLAVAYLCGYVVPDPVGVIPLTLTNISNVVISQCFERLRWVPYGYVYIILIMFAKLSSVACVHPNLVTISLYKQAHLMA